MDKEFKRKLYERIRKTSNPLLAKEPERGYALKKTIKDVFKKCMKYSIDHKKHLSLEEALDHAELASMMAVSQSIKLSDFRQRNRERVLDFIREKLRESDTPEEVIEMAEKDIENAIFEVFKAIAKGKNSSKFTEILNHILENSDLRREEIAAPGDFDLFPF